MSYASITTHLMAATSPSPSPPLLSPDSGTSSWPHAQTPPYGQSEDDAMSTDSAELIQRFAGLEFTSGRQKMAPVSRYQDVAVDDVEDPDMRQVALPFVPVTYPEFEGRIPTSANALAVWFFKQAVRSAADPVGAYITPQLFLPTATWSQDGLSNKGVVALRARADMLTQIARRRLQGIDAKTAKTLEKQVDAAFRQNLLPLLNAPSSGGRHTDYESSVTVLRRRDSAVSSPEPPSSPVTTASGDSMPRSAIARARNSLPAVTRHPSFLSISSSGSASAAGAGAEAMAEYVRALELIIDGLEQDGYHAEVAGRFVEFVVEVLADRIVDDVFALHQGYRQKMAGVLLASHTSRAATAPLLIPRPVPKDRKFRRKSSNAYSRVVRRSNAEAKVAVR